VYNVHGGFVLLAYFLWKRPLCVWPISLLPGRYCVEYVKRYMSAGVVYCIMTNLVHFPNLRSLYWNVWFNLF